jgi:hypothetical protein
MSSSRKSIRFVSSFFTVYYCFSPIYLLALGTVSNYIPVFSLVDLTSFSLTSSSSELLSSESSSLDSESLSFFFVFLFFLFFFFFLSFASSFLSSIFEGAEFTSVVGLMYGSYPELNWPGLYPNLLMSSLPKPPYFPLAGAAF